jgi:hypothetical protein
VAGTVTFSAQSADPWIGTWKVNLEKSTYSPGPKPTIGWTIKFESLPDGGMKRTIDAMNPEGKAIHIELVGAFDGNDYPVKDAQFPNTTAAFKRLDSRTFEVITKVDGKPTATNRVVISADSKTMTATITDKNREGQTVNNVIVSDKQ